MNRQRIAVLLIFSVLTAFAAGFWLGARKGANLNEAIVAPLRGAYAARALTDLKAEKPRGASWILESEVDRGLLSVNELLESPIRRFIGPITGTDLWYNLDDYATQLAKYRKANSSPFHDAYFAHDARETPEQRALIDDAVQRFTAKPQGSLT